MSAPSGGSFRGEEVLVLDLDVVARQGVGLEARLTESRATVVLPVVPRTDDVLAIQPPLGERSAGVITYSGEDSELAVHIRDDKPRRANLCL